MLKKCPRCNKITEHDIMESKNNKKIICCRCERKTFVAKNITEEELRNLTLFDFQAMRGKRY